MSEYQVIGKSLPRAEGPEKVTGSAHFTGDLSLPGTLWAKVLHSAYAHARIVRIDTSAAEALPGVHAVITGADTDGFYGSALKDLPVLARGYVRFFGERVAAVAADDEDIAQEALDLIDIEYEELPAVFEPLEAMEPDAPIIHPEFNTYPGVVETPMPGPFGGIMQMKELSNTYLRNRRDRGDLEKGFAEADVVVEHTYRTQRAHQGYLEPQNCLVHIDDTGRALVWAGSKMPFGSRGALAGAVGIAPQEILVQHTYVGGDFGGKGTPVVLPICYLLAKRTGRPVRLINEYMEEFMAGNPRHSTVIRLRSGVKKDGTITAHHVQFYVNCGAYAAFKPGGRIFGPEQSAGPYRIPNVRIESAHVYTNTVPGGYVRAPGEAQGVFALESHLDELAGEIGMDPAEFRLKNLADSGEEVAFGATFEHVRAKETIRAAVSASGYDQPRPPHVGRGIAIGERPAGNGTGNAAVTLKPDGSIIIGTPIFDQGVGAYTTMRQVVAEELKIDPDRIQIEIWNTDSVPSDSGLAGSWGTRIQTTVVNEAAQAAKRELIKAAAEHFDCAEDALSLRGDEILRTDIEERVRWQDFLSETGKTVEGRARIEGQQGGGVHLTAFAAQVAEVSVDPETGEVTLLRFTSVHDTGEVINPIGHQGQINGSVVQGIGYALMEELRVEDGRVTNLSFGDYKLPTVADLPELETVLLKSEEGHGPYNIKGIGEVPISPVAPAIANAVADALGIRVRDLPITAEKVYQGLKESGKS